VEESPVASSSPGSSVTSRRAARLAWGIATLSYTIVAACLVLLWLDRASIGSIGAGPVGNLVPAATLGALGALIASRRPANPIGWLMLGIATLNATAPMRHVVGGAVDAADVFDLGPDSARLEQWLRPMETGGHHGHQHLPFRHGEQIGSVVLRHDRPIAWASLRRWLESVLSLRGDAVLRLKGIVWLQGETQPIVLQGVHHVLHPVVYLDRPVQPAGATRIVLITRGLSPAGLRASFVAALAGAAIRRSR